MKKLLAILCGIASVFGALFFGMKLLGRFAKSSMRLELDEDGAEPEAGGSVQVERKDDSIWPRAGREWAEHMRLDKYLKVSRLIKRRTVANEACDAGRILVNGKAARRLL